eukprot:3957467-Prymnesium_polylepis.2
MGAVRTKAAVVVGADADAEEDDTERELERARARLVDMEASGYGEKFGKSALPGEASTSPLQTWARACFSAPSPSS